ncbi:MAG: hypothetical protein KC466_09450 [Myxococcales bacterium]|nr:hypothetical protein [Myxococcales bacterium]
MRALVTALSLIALIGAPSLARAALCDMMAKGQPCAAMASASERPCAPCHAPARSAHKSCAHCWLSGVQSAQEVPAEAAPPLGNLMAAAPLAAPHPLEIASTATPLARGDDAAPPGASLVVLHRRLRI